MVSYYQKKVKVKKIAPDTDGVYSLDQGVESWALEI